MEVLMTQEIMLGHLVHQDHAQREQTSGPQSKERVICEHPHGLVTSLWHPEQERMMYTRFNKLDELFYCIYLALENVQNRSKLSTVIQENMEMVRK